MRAVALKPGVITFRAAVLDHPALRSRPASPRVRLESGSDSVLSTDTVIGDQKCGFRARCARNFTSMDHWITTSIDGELAAWRKVMRFSSTANGNRGQLLPAPEDTPAAVL